MKKIEAGIDAVRLLRVTATDLHAVGQAIRAATEQNDLAQVLLSMDALNRTTEGSLVLTAINLGATWYRRLWDTKWAHLHGDARREQIKNMHRNHPADPDLSPYTAKDTMVVSCSSILLMGMAIGKTVAVDQLNRTNQFLPTAAVWNPVMGPIGELRAQWIEEDLAALRVFDMILSGLLSDEHPPMA